MARDPVICDRPLLTDHGFKLLVSVQRYLEAHKIRPSPSRSSQSINALLRLLVYLRQSCRRQFVAAIEQNVRSVEEDWESEEAAGPEVRRSRWRNCHEIQSKRRNPELRIIGMQLSNLGSVVAGRSLCRYLRDIGLRYGEKSYEKMFGMMRSIWWPVAIFT